MPLPKETQQLLEKWLATREAQGHPPPMATPVQAEPQTAPMRTFTGAAHKALEAAVAKGVMACIMKREAAKAQRANAETIRSAQLRGQMRQMQPRSAGTQGPQRAQGPQGQQRPGTQRGRLQANVGPVKIKPQLEAQVGPVQINPQSAGVPMMQPAAPLGAGY